MSNVVLSKEELEGARAIGYVPIREASAKYGVSLRSMYQRIREEEILTCKVRGLVFVRESDVALYYRKPPEAFVKAVDLSADNALRMKLARAVAGAKVRGRVVKGVLWVDPVQARAFLDEVATKAKFKPTNGAAKDGPSPTREGVYQDDRGRFCVDVVRPHGTSTWRFPTREQAEANLPRPAAPSDEVAELKARIAKLEKLVLVATSGATNGAGKERR